MTKARTTDEPSTEMEATPQQALKEAQAQVKRLKRLTTELRRQLKKERAGPPPSAEALEATIQEAQAQVDSMQAETNEAKSLAKKRKREIDEWKLWYQGLPGIDKTAEWAKLQNEIDWRGVEIHALEEQISGLETESLNATGRLEMAKQSLEALNAGVYDRPLDEDPRLVALQAEREVAKANVESLKQTVESGS